MYTFFFQQHGDATPHRINQITVGRDQRRLQWLTKFRTTMITYFAAHYRLVYAVKNFNAKFLQRATGYWATQYFEQPGVNLTH